MAWKNGEKIHKIGKNSLKNRCNIEIKQAKTKSAFLCYYLRIDNKWHNVHTRE